MNSHTMKLIQNYHIVITDDEVSFEKCELTRLFADCVEVTAYNPNREIVAAFWLNRSDAVSIINDDYFCPMYYEAHGSN